MSTWQPVQGGRVGGLCQFFLPNLNPQPPCTCTDWENACDCGCNECTCEASEWHANELCQRPARVRVELADGQVFDTCSPEAHGVGQVVWWGPVYGPRHQSFFDQMMDRMYAVDRIVKMATSPAFAVSRDTVYKLVKFE